MPDACPDCPLCGQPPLYRFDQQYWDPTVTAEENRANAHYVDLREGRGHD